MSGELDLFSQIVDAAKPKEKAKDVIKADTKVRVDVSIKTNGVEKESKAEQKVLKSEEFDQEPNKLWIDYGFTKNLGNYESAKISIGVSLPIGRPITPQLKAEIEQTSREGMAILDEILGKEIQKLNDFVEAKKKAESKPLF